MRGEGVHHRKNGRMGLHLEEVPELPAQLRLREFNRVDLRPQLWHPSGMHSRARCRTGGRSPPCPERRTGYRLSTLRVGGACPSTQRVWMKARGHLARVSDPQSAKRARCPCSSGACALRSAPLFHWKQRRTQRDGLLSLSLATAKRGGCPRIGLLAFGAGHALFGRGLVIGLAGTVQFEAALKAFRRGLSLGGGQVAGFLLCAHCLREAAGLGIGGSEG